MLLEGQRLKAEGIDVVIGYLETHGRAETAQLAEGLEIVPRRREEYRGVVLEEMDADAVTVRKPAVALIDELAHTNAPGSRNPKRYQDVQDILAAGIHVITTLNVQHLESLYDTVEKSVRVKVRERLPDTILAEADEIVNVDVTPEDLRKRLQEGKIYPPERIPTALDHFFKETNLETLRELTLRELAAQIDLRRREQVEESEISTPDQIMVCLSSRGPNSERLLRYSSRLAGRLNRNWYALYVQTPSEDPAVVDLHTQRILSGTLTLAKQLGAMIFTYKGQDIVDTILRFVREYRVGHIVIGSPGRVPVWKRILGKKNVVERLIDQARGVTIVVLDTHEETGPETSRTGQIPVEAPRQEPPVAPAQQLVLSSLLSGDRIQFWDEPVPKEIVLRGLVNSMKGVEVGDPETVLIQLLKREQVASTFLNEGVAFPHLRIEGLQNPAVSLGIAKRGISDLSTDQPVNLIFLLLSPKEQPSVQIHLLSVAARAARSRHLLQNLLDSSNSTEALAAMKQWEVLAEHRPETH